MPHTNNAFLEAERALKECESENILIDFHAEATSEKNAFFRLFCGRVGAIARRACWAPPVQCASGALLCLW